MITLFIGGSHDGARIDIDDARNEIRLPVIEALSMGTITVETPKEAIFEVDHYVRSTVHYADGSSVSIFALKAMTGREITRALVDGYRVAPTTIRGVAFK